MQRIILIETSTALCSAAIAEDGAVTAYRESSAPKAHASLTSVFIDEMLKERGLTLADCDAVCVSMGPGSYTGLRVGVSTAKGLCFGSGKPLLAVGTLDTLVAQAVSVISSTSSVIPSTSSVIPSETSVISSEVEKSPSFKYIIPMIDARRMEVYTAVFEKTAMPSPTTIMSDLPTVKSDLPTVKSDSSTVISDSSTVISSEVEKSISYHQLAETAPMIIDETSFAEYLEQGPCLFIGDGAGKCADVLKHPNAHFCQCWPQASAMLVPALAAFAAGDFKDVAYFEPFYLKEFVATVSKKKLF